MLPNAEMSDPAYIKKHGIKVIKVGFNHIHSAPRRDEEVPEYSYLVRATNTMSEDDWVRANLFSVCVQCFHALGALRFFAIWLYTERGVGYYDFYTALLRFILQGSGLLSDLWNGFREKYESSLAGDWNYHNEAFGSVTWFFEEGACLEIVNGDDAVMDALLPLLREYDIPGDLFGELVRYQKLMLRKPFETAHGEDFTYDLYPYFERILRGAYAPLQKADNTLFVTPAAVYTDFPEYARETVWYGRRRGASVYGKKEISRRAAKAPRETE
jgi:hypothetical protein